MDEKMIQKLNTIISVVFIVAAVALFGVAIKNRGGKDGQSVQDAVQTPKTDVAAAAYADLAGMKRLELAKDFASWTPGANVEDEKVRTGSLVVSGTVAKAYLTVKASIDGKPLTKYESIFVKLNDVGGHLFRPSSLETPESGSTSLLYPLNAAPVLPSVPYDETRTPEMRDLSALLVDGKTVRLTAFISSLRPALLEELSISYVCADGSDCAIILK